MSKTVIVYWSATGNTEAMANAVKEGAASADIYSVSDISADAAAGYDNLILGCPAMGAEELEEAEFRPFFEELKPSLSGKNVALFGSYDWGDGEWMRKWADEVKDAGANLVNGEGLIANNTPDDDALAACKALGEKTASL
ncbi:MAG: flavodoxin [Firmicutes bacterium]|nr:flavodoxin [Bacillota bacterium]